MSEKSNNRKRSAEGGVKLFSDWLGIIASVSTITGLTFYGIRQDRAISWNEFLAVILFILIGLFSSAFAIATAHNFMRLREGHGVVKRSSRIFTWILIILGISILMVVYTFLVVNYFYPPIAKI